MVEKVPKLPFKKMTLETRIETYLRNCRETPVQRSLVLDKALEHGFTKKQFWEAFEKITNRVNVGTWHGTKDGRTWTSEVPTSWVCWYDMSDEEIKSRQDDILWFSLL